MIKLPYGRQTITEADIEAVSMVVLSDWLTTGPKVTELLQSPKDHFRKAEWNPYNH